MKNARLFLFLLVSALIVSTVPAMVFAADPADINAAFPDAQFRAYVKSEIDKDKDGKLSDAEIRAVTSISAEAKNIEDLTGIELFINLKKLDCSDNKLTDLDVSKNTALTNLKCNYNGLVELDVSKNIALTELDCSDNKLEKLSIAQNIALKDLRCSDNKLSDLVVSQNAALTYLDCSFNGIESLDVTKNTALTYLNCYSNKLSELNVSQNIVLTRLSCGCNQLKNINVSKNTALTLLDVGGNKIAQLDISNNTQLIDFSCRGNYLEKIDLSQNTKLKILRCYQNKLTTLDVSMCSDLEELNYWLNPIEKCNLSKNAKLKKLKMSPRIDVERTDDGKATFSFKTLSPEYVTLPPQFVLSDQDASIVVYGGATPIKDVKWNPKSLNAAWSTKTPIRIIGWYNKNKGQSIEFDVNEVVVLSINEPSFNLTTIVEGGNGRIAPKGTKRIREFDTETIEFMPDTGYKIAEVTVNGVKTDVPYNMLDVTMDEDKTVVVTYKPDKIPVQYSAGIQGSKFWQGWKQDGQLAGTTGKSLRMEGLQIKLPNNLPFSGGIRYNAQIQGIGWQGWKADGAIAGFNPQKSGGKRLESIRVQLTGEIANHYDVWYHVHTERFGWMGWAKNGEIAGTVGYSFRTEAIEVVILPKGSPAPKNYSAVYTKEPEMVSFVRTNSYDNRIWQGRKGEGDISGTRGQKKTALAIGLSGTGIPVQYRGSGITYSVYQDGKWLGWKANDYSIGNGNGGAIQGLKVKLTGNIARDYDVYYRVEIKKGNTAFWMNWAKNGAITGWKGMNIEQIQVAIVPKGTPAPTVANNSKQRWALRIFPASTSISRRDF